MAIVDLVTTEGALAGADRVRLTAELAAATYEAEGFAGSAIAPALCWIFIEERGPQAFSTGAGRSAAPLYYVRVSALQGALSGEARSELGERITSILLSTEASAWFADLTRVWVQFIDIADGDLIVGGEATSLDGLRALVSGAV